MGARHSKHRKYPVQPSGLAISSPYPPGRSGFEEAAVTRNNPLFSSGGGGRGGGGGGGGGGCDVYQTYGSRPAPPPVEDLDQAPLQPEERLRRSIIRSRRGQHRHAERRKHSPTSGREGREDTGLRKDSGFREEREESAGGRLSARSSARSAQVRAQASVHSWDDRDPGGRGSGEPRDHAPREEKDPVTTLQSSQGQGREWEQEEQGQEETPVPRPAPRTLFGMMPDVVGRSAPRGHAANDQGHHDTGKVTIAVAWRDRDDQLGRSSSANPAGLNDIPIGVTHTDNGLGESDGDAAAVSRSGGGSCPVAGDLESPLLETWSTVGEATNVPVAPETGAATAGWDGGGGGGGAVSDKRRAVKWGDNVGDLPARLEGIVEATRDPQTSNWSRQLMSIRGHTLVTPDRNIDLSEVTAQPAPATSHGYTIKLCRGPTVELFLKLRSRDDYNHWLTMLKSSSARESDEVSSDGASNAAEDKVSVAYGDNSTVNISYSGAPYPEPKGASEGGTIEFESWEVSGEAAEAAVDLGEEGCSDVSDQPISASDAPGLAAGRTGGGALFLEDFESKTPPPAFADRPPPAQSVRWDLELSSPDLQRRAARGSHGTAVVWDRPGTPPIQRLRRRSASPPAGLTPNPATCSRPGGAPQASSQGVAGPARHQLRSVETQTDSGKFGLRRAGSEWTLLDRGPQTASIRSERIRRAAQMFEEIAQAERVAALALSPLPRRPAPAFSPEPEHEPEPKQEQSHAMAAEQERRSLVAANRSVDAIVALGGGGGDSDDSDRDDESEELLWLRVKTKIAERRRKFHQLDLSARGGGGPEEARTVQAAPLSPLLARPAGSSPLTGSEGASSPVTSVSAGDDVEGSCSTGDSGDPLRCWTGKYIEQDEEQEVLRGLGNPVLAEQKLHLKLKARTRLEAGRAESERQRQRIQEQRDQTQLKLEQVKAKLTRDGAFERKRLETVLFRLDQSIREEQQRLDQLTKRIGEADDDIEELGRRLSHLVNESDTSVASLSPLE